MPNSDCLGCTRPEPPEAQSCTWDERYCPILRILRNTAPILPGGTIPVAPDAPAGENSWVDPEPPSGDGESKTWEIPDDSAALLAAWYGDGLKWR
jgi:hypothetical protein